MSIGHVIKIAGEVFCHRQVRALLAVSVLLSTSTAAAQPQDEAAEWFLRGRRLHAAGDTAAAYEAYVRSHRLRPSYDAAGNAAQQARKLGRWADACNLAGYSRRHLPSSMPAKKRLVAAQLLDGVVQDALKHVGRIRVETADGATLRVDDTQLGRIPLDPPSYCVRSGQHQVSAALTGYAPRSTTIKVTPGETFVVRLPLTTAAPPAAASVALVEGNDTNNMPQIGVLIGLTAAAVSGAGVGLGLLVAAGNKSDDAAKRLATIDVGGCIAGGPHVDVCNAVTAEQDAALALQAGGIAALSIGGALAVTAVIYGLWPHGDTNGTAAVRVVPMAGPAYGGAVVRGRF